MSKKNVKVVFVYDLIMLTGNCNEGDELIMSRTDADYFAEWIKELRETDEAENFRTDLEKQESWINNG